MTHPTNFLVLSYLFWCALSHPPLTLGCGDSDFLTTHSLPKSPFASLALLFKFCYYIKKQQNLCHCPLSRPGLRSDRVSHRTLTPWTAPVSKQAPVYKAQGLSLSKRLFSRY